MEQTKPQQQQQPKKKPEKQGGLYSLNLGQNNGPFLTKDIMITNQKSLDLLTGKDDVIRQAASILGSKPSLQLDNRGNALDLNQPQDYYDENYKAYINYDERFKAKLNAAENIGSNSSFAIKQTQKLQENFQFYKEQIASYRKDLETMHEQIHNSNMNNIREIQPMLKEFHTRLKDKLLDGKNDNYKLQRELEQLQREKLQIQQQILFSHKRILELEKSVGIFREEDINNNNSPHNNNAYHSSQMDEGMEYSQQSESQVSEFD